MAVELTTTRGMQYRDLPGVKLRRAASLRGEKPLPKVCMWCCGPLTGRQQSWCSQRCVDEYLVRKGGQRARELVYERDHGVCARCGLDTDAIVQKLAAWRARALAALDADESPELREHRHGTSWRSQVYWNRRNDIHREHDRMLASRLRIGAHGHAWEAHHVVAVIEGGGWCGLDGLVTLCMKCHHAESAELQRRRRHERATASTSTE